MTNTKETIAGVVGPMSDEVYNEVHYRTINPRATELQNMAQDFRIDMSIAKRAVERSIKEDLIREFYGKQ